jgi:sugar phosphate isomerase/epimerase
MTLRRDRRDFLRTTTGLLGAGLLSFDTPARKQRMQLCYTTLGCPDWALDKIVKAAKENGYQGIEIRGILREMDLPRASDFSTPDRIRSARKMAEDAGIKFAALGASAAMHHAAGPDRDKAIDEGKRFIDLAQALGCPYVRVFPNNLPKDREKTATFDLIRSGLRTLAEHAKDTNVSVLMETHGEVLLTADIVEIMKDIDNPKAGLVWDIVNMWSVTKEMPISVYPKIAPWIRHVHVKDYKMANSKMRYCYVGQGIAPVFQALDLLVNGGYKGFYGFEWEKLWHPEIEEPEEAIPYYVRVMRGFEMR